MAAFFTRERFGRPQLYAGLLLLAFTAQCLWVIVRLPLYEAEVSQIHRGLQQWQRGIVTAGTESPFVALLASALAAPFNRSAEMLPALLVVLFARLPFLFVGILCGASLWYVTRRLYGNPGGYVALMLYCFSPLIVESSALVDGKGPSAWGFFGAIFSGIALSHTVYALGESPHRQLTALRHWRWRRIVLLGVAFGIAVAAQFSAALAIPLALGFMLYLAPGRRTACFAIVAVASMVCFVFLLAACFFNLPAVGQTLLHQAPPDVFSNFRFISLGFPFRSLSLRQPLVMVLFVLSLLTYIAWRRTRYFGNSAPLLVLAIIWLASLPFPGLAFNQHFLIFAIVFIAGLAADLLDTSRRKLVLAGLTVLLLLHVGWGVLGTLRLTGA